MKFKPLITLSLSFYFLLILGLMLISNGISFIFAGIIYCLFIILATFLVKKENRNGFLTVVSFFLFLYSFFSILSHIAVINNPVTDFLVNIDEVEFFKQAVLFSEKSYSQIWMIAFEEFQFSDAPLFWAWIGFLQKFADLPIWYALLFQKLNVTLFACLIPGIVFLLCRKITDENSALKAALFYGVFSFTLFFSAGLMRDIHITLIYCIGFYLIINNNSSLKNYVFLIILFTLAYFIRVESGLFFLAFVGAWIWNSRNRNKLTMVLSGLVLAGFILWIGGLDPILNRMGNTMQTYNERAVTLADNGSLGVELMNLPTPINYLGLTAFGQVLPFPFWIVFDEGITLTQKLYYLPKALAALFWIMIWLRLLRNKKKSIEFIKKYKFAVFIALLYLLMVSMTQFMPRRLMAVYPQIFMLFIFIDNKVFKAKNLLYLITIYVILIITYFSLKL